MDERRQLLVIDDDVHIRKLIELYLRSSSYDVRSAATGEEALALIAENHFDVVLVDLILPNFGGFRICRKLKAKKSERRPHVIMITGDDSAETRDQAFEAGADAFIAKPFRPDELRDTLEKLASSSTVA